MTHPIADMLGTALAQAENPKSMRLNQALTETDIVETIRTAIDELNSDKIASAAPEMLEALKALRNASGKLRANTKESSLMVGCLIEADDAIAKAEGILK